MTFKNTYLISLAKQLCIQVIQFQTIQVFLFSSIISDIDQMIYKSADCKEWEELDEFIQNMEVDDKEDLEDKLRKSFKTMIKTGAAKIADIKIPE